jgi:N-acetylneuraminate synthase
LNVLKQFSIDYPNNVLGLSDHTAGHATTLGAIALGARVIEKHFTDDNNQEGPDHGFAMNPNSWRNMVDRSYELLVSLGDGVKIVEKNEEHSRLVQRRCLRVTINLKKGHILKDSDFISLRPISEGGFEPFEKVNLIGKELLIDINAGEHLTKKTVKL